MFVADKIVVAVAAIFVTALVALYLLYDDVVECHLMVTNVVTKFINNKHLWKF